MVTMVTLVKEAICTGLVRFSVSPRPSYKINILHSYLSFCTCVIHTCPCVDNPQENIYNDKLMISTRHTHTYTHTHPFLTQSYCMFSSTRHCKYLDTNTNECHMIAIHTTHNSHMTHFNIDKVSTFSGAATGCCSMSP